MYLTKKQLDILEFIQDSVDQEAGLIPVGIGVIAGLSEANTLISLVGETYQPLVEDLIDVSARSYIAYAPDPAYDIEVSGERVTVGLRAVSRDSPAGQLQGPSILFVSHIEEFADPLPKGNRCKGAERLAEFDLQIHDGLHFPRTCVADNATAAEGTWTKLHPPLKHTDHVLLLDQVCNLVAELAIFGRINSLQTTS